MLSFLLLCQWAAIVASQIISPSVQHAKRAILPVGWSRARRYSSDAIIPLRFGLSQPNTDMRTLELLLHGVSHPDSPAYGQHWTPARVARHFAPTDESIGVVTAWLSQSGIRSNRLHMSKSKGWVAVNATVSETEVLLSTEYHVFVHSESGKEHIACDQYYLPAHVAPHIQIVTPSVDFNVVLSKRHNGNSFSTEVSLGQPRAGTVFPQFTDAIDTLVPGTEHCDKQITPGCLRALYNFHYSPISGEKNSFGVVEYTPQAYVPSDLDKFATNFSAFSGPSLVGSRPSLSSIAGGVVQTASRSFDFNGESNLDLEYAMNLVSANQPVTLYQVGDLQMGASFNNLLDALDGSFCSFEGGDDQENDGIYPDPLPGGYQGQDCGSVKPANVISTSYGYNEADLSPAYTVRQCAEYAKLGLMGVTVLYSSGDNGAAGNGGLCLNPDGSQTSGGRIFNPSFPSTCPFVTSVGATQINPGATVADPESACQQVISSGGGFSNYFAIPDYQKGAVGEYLTAHSPPYSNTTYNSTGTSRAYPDLSANGANYVTAVNGGFFLVYGTSASAPVVGAMLTMINDARLAMGKRPVGFINPTIYSPAFRGAFNDITTGTNPGCGTKGFSTAPGFDPVTGLGTPQFDKLLFLWSLLP
ncbi:Subtilisin-like protein [Mycena indigotica]|uniref:tripeptidyl-peptidase II n=1 Tax=Mycena indigotica TaxID=2126181 RepID=A0A8H6S2V9_9AGAR|nr:Subtilisin-like protein [Mycena indigotica]KAF7291889.1 Subtilisin-like protein [Mycena indigotica]